MFKLRHHIKTTLLFLISLASLTLYFLIPKNREWLNKKSIAYWNDFRKNRKNTDLERRKTIRWDKDYVFSKQIANQLAAQNQKDALVLLPPSQYFIDRKINFHVPEPAVFYYYTGVKTAWINSQKATQANWMVIARDKQLELLHVTDPQMLADSIRSFKKYPVKL